MTGMSKHLGPESRAYPVLLGDRHPHCSSLWFYKPGCWCCTPGHCMQLLGYAPAHADEITSLLQLASHVTLGNDSISRSLSILFCIMGPKVVPTPQHCVRHPKTKSRRGLARSLALGNHGGRG